MVRIRVQSVRVLWENGLAGPNDGETHDTGTLLPMQSTRTALLFAALVTIGGCSFEMPSLGVYKIDIPQGNIVTQEMVDKLKPGMSKRQVRFVMGTALMQDTFEPERWDYVRSLETRKQKRSQQRISLFFEKDVLVRMEGDMAPGSTSAASTPAETKVPETKP